jgi:hypothetical protein
MIVNGGEVRNWGEEEVVFVHLKVQLWLMHPDTEKEHENPQPG